MPLVTQARDWEHGVFLGSIMSSEKTAAAAGTIGEVRFDPFAMLPFMGYNAGDYMNHWLHIGRKGDPDKLPKLFWVNWFRKDQDGRFIWPGFGDNIRVLKWIIAELDGVGNSVDTPIGLVPTVESIDRSGIEVTDEEMAALLEVDRDSWKGEIPLIHEHFEFLGERLPSEVRAQLDELEDRLADY